MTAYGNLEVLIFMGDTIQPTTVSIFKFLRTLSLDIQIFGLID